MSKSVTARTLSPLVGLLAALALVAAAVLAGMLTSAGHDQAGAFWNKISSDEAGAFWNTSSHDEAGAFWNKVGGGTTDGAFWN